MSYDAIDLIEMEPESSNPYQFVYNNPHVYSDPTGIFSIMELNSTISVQDALSAFKTYASNEIKGYFKNKIGAVMADSFTGIVKRLLPFAGVELDQIPGRFKDGHKFEDFLKGQICGIFNSVGGPFLNRLWLEPGVLENRTPTYEGLNCQMPGNTNSAKLKGIKGSRPDFLFKEGSPIDTTNKAYLIGDVKLTLHCALSDITGIGKKGAPSNQWTAIRAYADKHVGPRTALYITFKHEGNGSKRLSAQQEQHAIARASKSAFEKRVLLIFICQSC